MVSVLQLTNCIIKKIRSCVNKLNCHGTASTDQSSIDSIHALHVFILFSFISFNTMIKQMHIHVIIFYPSKQFLFFKVKHKSIKIL